jgi:hypothetical protein
MAATKDESVMPLTAVRVVVVVLIGAVAIGAVAIGALAIGFVAVGRLRIGQLGVKRGTFDQLEVATLHVGHLTVKDLVIEHDNRD